MFFQKKSKNPKPQHRLVAALEHHLSEWHRLGAPELVRQYLEEEEKATKNGETSKESRKKTRFRRASATVLEVSALPPPTPPLVSSRPEPYLLTLHIPLCSSRSSSRLTAAGVAEGDIPSGLGPHVSWGRDGEEGRGEGRDEGGDGTTATSFSPTSSPFAHRASVWFGAGGALVTLSPATYSRRVLDTEQEAVTLVSALAVASGASGCPWPCCVPSGDGRRDGWLGVGPRGRGLVESEASRRLAARARGPPRRLAAPAGAAALLAARAAPRAPRAAEALRAALEPAAGIGAAAAALAASRGGGGGAAAPCSSSFAALSSSPHFPPPPVRHVVEVDARASYRVPVPPLGASEAEKKGGRGAAAAAAAAASGGERGWDDGAPWRPWLLFPRCYPDPCRAGIEVDACWDAVPGRDAFGLNEEEDELDDYDDDDDSGESDGGGGGARRGGVRASSVWRVHALSPFALDSSSPAAEAEAAAGGGRSSSAGGAEAAAAAAAASGDASSDGRAAPLRLLPAALAFGSLPPPPRPPTGGLASLVARLASSFTIAASARSMRDLESDRWWDARGTDASSPVWPLPRAPAAEAVAAACADVLDVDAGSDEGGDARLALLPEGVLAAAGRGEPGAAAAVAALRRFAAPPPLLPSSSPSSPSSSTAASSLPRLLPRLAPAASLASRLALRAAALAAATGSSSGSSGGPGSGPTGDARAVAALWSSVVRELRFSLWERGRRLPRPSEGRAKGGRRGRGAGGKPRLPDARASLLHQKLQMLDCCIAARAAAAERAARAGAAAAEAAAAAAAGVGGEAPGAEGAAAAAAAARRPSWLPWPLAHALSTLASSAAPLAAAAAGEGGANEGAGTGAGDDEMLDAEEGVEEEGEGGTKHRDTDEDEAWASAASSSAWATSSSSSPSSDGDDDEGDDDEEEDDEEPRREGSEDVEMEDASAAAASAPLRRTRSAAAAHAAAPAAASSLRGPRPPRGARGVLRVVPGGRARGRLPLCEPRTQRRPPETGDAAAARLSAAWALRERSGASSSPSPSSSSAASSAAAAAAAAAAADALACPLVASDMAAFKAANPSPRPGSSSSSATLEEFLGWRPPRGPPPPWAAPTAASGEKSKSKSSRGLPSRADVEAWRGVWEASAPCPASSQRPLFDAEAEGERALHWLETLPPEAAWRELVPLAAAAAAALLAAGSGGNGGGFPAATSLEGLFAAEDEGDEGKPRRRSALACFCEEARPLLLALSEGDGARCASDPSSSSALLLSGLAGAVARVEPTLLAAEALRRRLGGAEEKEKDENQRREKGKGERGAERLASRVLSAATGWNGDSAGGGGRGVPVAGGAERAAFDALMRSGSAAAAATAAAAAGPLAAASAAAAASSSSSSRDRRGPSALAIAVPGWGPPMEAEWAVRCEPRRAPVAAADEGSKRGGGGGTAPASSRQQQRQQQKRQNRKQRDRLIGSSPGWRGGQRAHVCWSPAEGVRLSCVLTPEDEEEDDGGGFSEE